MSDENTPDCRIGNRGCFAFIFKWIGLAEQLQILQDNHVPVIFLPYHETEGNGGRRRRVVLVGFGRRAGV